MKRILTSDWVFRIIGVLVLVGIVLFTFGTVLKVTVPPTSLFTITPQTDRVVVSIEVNAKSQSYLNSFFDRLGVSGKDFVHGFEVGLDASSSASMAAFPYKRFSFYGDDRVLEFGSQESYSYPSDTPLWEGTKFVPADSLVYYTGPVGDLKFVWKLTDRQLQWFDGVSASSSGFFNGGIIDSSGRGAAFAVLAYDSTESASLYLEKLKDVPFENVNGVLGYSEKEFEGTRFYLGFINAAIVNKDLVLADNADVLERVVRVVKGELPSYEASFSGMREVGVRAFHIANPLRITKLSDGPLFLTLNPYGNADILKSVSRFVFIESDSGLWGSLLLY